MHPKNRYVVLAMRPPKNEAKAAVAPIRPSPQPNVTKIMATVLTSIALATVMCRVRLASTRIARWRASKTESAGSGTIRRVGVSAKVVSSSVSPEMFEK